MPIKISNRIVGYIFSITTLPKRFQQQLQKFFTLLGTPPKAEKIGTNFSENLEVSSLTKGKKLAIKLCLILRFTQTNWQLLNKKVRFEALNEWALLTQRPRFLNWSSFYEKARTYFRNNC